MESEHEEDVSKCRWWVIFLFCCVNILQGILWNTSSPVSQSMKAVFGWQDDDIVSIALLLKLADAAAVFPASLTIQKYGLRFQVCSISFLLLVTAGLRCLPLPTTYLALCFKVGALTNGVAWRMVDTCIGRVSNDWFPVNEFTLSVGLCIISQAIGGGVSYIIGPMTLPIPVYSTSNTCSEPISSNMSCIVKQTRVLSNFIDIKTHLTLLYIVEASVVAFIFLLVGFSFPKKPEKQLIKPREDKKYPIKEVGKELLKTKVFWLTLLPSMLVIGNFVIFRSILDVVLHPMGINQIDAGWIGFGQSFVACAFGIASILTSGYIGGYKKVQAYCLLLVSAYCFTWLSLIAVGVVPFSLGQVYASCILGGTFVVSFLPLLTEIAGELVYPLPEGVFMNYITLGTNVSSSCVLLILILVEFDYRYVTWIITGAVYITIVIVCFFPNEPVSVGKETYDNIDSHKDDTPKSVILPETDENIMRVQTSTIQGRIKDGAFSWE